MSKWVETKGRKPKTDQPLFVRFRNGVVSQAPYTTRQLRWDEKGDEWDIVAVKRA